MEFRRVPTIEAIEAALSAVSAQFDPLREDLESGRGLDVTRGRNTDAFREVDHVEQLIDGSVSFSEFISGAEELIELVSSEPDQVTAAIRTIIARSFLLGWHARGAVDEAAQLNRMTE